jgi:hypothetical protein
MTRLVTASSLLRAKRCPTSYALPQLRETSEAAEQGNENHAAIEAQLRGHEKFSPELEACIGGEGISHVEAAFVLDVHTGAVRFVGEGVGRAYGNVDETREIPMTLDLVTERCADRMLIIRDWKSRKRVTPAERNDQVRAQAVAVMGYHHVDQVEAGLTYLDNWEQDMATVDVFERAAILAELRETLAKVQAAQPTDPVHLGPWCEYCPAMVSCTGRTAMLRHAAEVVRVDKDTMAATIGAMTDEEAGDCYEKVVELQAMAETALGLLKKRAERIPLPLSNGMVLMKQERQKMDVAATRKLLNSLGHELPEIEKPATKTVDLDAARELLKKLNLKEPKQYSHTVMQPMKRKAG